MIAEQHVLALPAGYQLGKYLFKGVLGSGGFGITYLAEDITLNRKVAVKEMLPNDFATRIDGTTVVAKTEGEKGNLAWARTRFVDEGRALAACDHPNVVNVYEMIEANGTAYMVTKYEEGCSLERWLRDLGRAPSESELRGILAPLLSGLERVHRAGFLHRDIKPDNIYLTTDGRPVLLDFGSARQAVTSRSMVMTSIVSTGYAPFEQYHEDGKQGPWSDIYALGAVMYRAITGSKPPEAVRRLQNDPCQKLATAYTGRYGANFLSAIDRALNVNESQRPQTVADWRNMMDSSGQAVPAVSPVLPQTGEQRGKNVAATSNVARPFSKQIAVGVGLLVLAAIGAWFFYRPKPSLLVEASVKQSADTGKQTSAELQSPKQRVREDQSPPKGQQVLAEQPASKEQPAPKEQSAVVVQPAPKEQPAVAVQPAPKEQPAVAVQPAPKEQPAPTAQSAPKEQPAVAVQPAPDEQPTPAVQPTPKEQPAVAVQPAPSEQPAPAVQPPPKEQQQTVRSSDSPSSDAVVVQEPTPEKAVRSEEPERGQRVVVQSPPNNDEGHSTQSTQTPKSQIETASPVSGTPTSGPAGDATTVDPKLVGTWEGKPNGSKGAWERQWQQQQDGSYAISGSLTETGNLTASDGKIEKYLDGAQEPSEVLYKFVGNTLITMDPDGNTTVWRLVSADSSKSKSAGSKTSANPVRHSRHVQQSSGRSPGIIHEIRRFLPF
jgi:serine/threonine protein kinase